CDAPFRAFREHGVWQTPTLVVRRNRAFLDDSTVVPGPGVDRAPEALRAEWSATRASRRERGREYFAAARDRHREERWLTGRLDAAGIPLLAGSDAGALYSVHGFSLHEELELLVAAGLSPAGALRAATVGPAAFLGARDSLGTIAEGSRADLLLLEADPLEDIRNTRRIRAVVLRGRYLGRPALDSLLAAGPAL
ncbi:MAG: amidohydrolase family protein, partial [Gemmatimonadetes bacterium]|nr:amidohydrolase family protein [Gemmatimonadota bacterium]NIQ53844.1 amidohydrolase family protein [Gemmatimonadota bacterium]NIU74011.1 amidohydrolase family protein [Gammaproteobacteria bacterium]NIX44080.1 amidohydrolase family protein [Gemmatimonadota bacterium]NIY08298.1 amidohydrolase family protein [Gemmatimonadota bacterium]